MGTFVILIRSLLFSFKFIWRMHKLDSVLKRARVREFCLSFNNKEHRLFNILSRPRVAYIHILSGASMKSCGVGKVNLFFYYSYCCFLHTIIVCMCWLFIGVKWNETTDLSISHPTISFVSRNGLATDKLHKIRLM